MKLKPWAVAPLTIALGAAGLALSGPVSATNGYFSHGNGMKAKGRAGVSMTFTDDTFGGANNPASMVWAGNRLDVGVDYFRPVREASRSGLGPYDFSGESDGNNFFIPELGYNKMYGDKWSLGVSVYANGGLNTDWQIRTSGPSPVPSCNGVNANILLGCGDAGVDLMQLIIAPTWAYKVGERHAIGFSPLIVYQNIEANGLQSFQSASVDAGSVTNRGHHGALGFGGRVGYLGKLTDRLSVGAAYTTEVSMDTFDQYKGLLAEGGEFDIPQTVNVGVAFKPIDPLTLAVDYQKIFYGDVGAIGNPGSRIFDCPSFGAGGTNVDHCLGGSGGPGFGWRDIDVWKFGVEFELSSLLAFRAGYSHSENPIPDTEVTFNTLAPAVIQNHFTLGATYGLNDKSEVTVAYMHAFEEEQTGRSLLNMPGTNATETIRMRQNSFGVTYGMKF